MVKSRYNLSSNGDKVCSLVRCRITFKRIQASSRNLGALGVYIGGWSWSSSKRNFENDINRANRSRDRNSLSVMKRRNNTNENFSTRDTEAYPRHGQGRKEHTFTDRGGWSCCGQKVRCQMLPTSAINPNTNLLFPSTSNRSKEERVEIAAIVVQTIFLFWGESQISRVAFFFSSLWNVFWSSF